MGQLNKRIRSFFIPESIFEKVFLFGFLYLLVLSILSKILPTLGREMFHVIPYLSLFFILYCLLYTICYVLTASLGFMKNVIADDGGLFAAFLYFMAGVTGLVTTGIIGWRAFQSPMWVRSRLLFENYEWHDYAFWTCGILFIVLYIGLRIRESRVNAEN